MSGIVNLFNGHILNKSYEKIDLNDEQYQGKIFGLYFSASWCRTSHSFTPKLIEFYEKIFKTKFEIIWISSDHDEESFEEYYDEMPWLTLDFDEDDIKDSVEKKYNIIGIPKLILVDGDSGEIYVEMQDNKFKLKILKEKIFRGNQMNNHNLT